MRLDMREVILPVKPEQRVRTWNGRSSGSNVLRRPKMHSPVRQEDFESLFDYLIVHGTLIMLPARKPESTQAFQ
jgi:hypothetical protein